MRGRKPKPTALQQLHGDPSKHGRVAMAQRQALEATDDRLEPPDDFTDAERDIWRDAVAAAPPGILRRIDGSVLTAWVIACDLHKRARMMQRRTSLLMQVPQKEGGRAIPQQSPLIGIINRQAKIMQSCAAELGFSPTSRPRIYAGTPAPLGSDAIAVPASSRAQSLDDYIDAAPPPPAIH